MNVKSIEIIRKKKENFRLLNFKFNFVLKISVVSSLLVLYLLIRRTINIFIGRVNNNIKFVAVDHPSLSLEGGKRKIKII